MRMKMRLSAGAVFLLAVAAGILALRLIIFDFGELFERRSIPSHDLYQGAGLFCPNMHSMRISGDLAWWNPVGEQGGYAQCYNAFLSPLAPTCGHIVTIAWAQFIRALSLVGISIPEYYQYLIVNLVALPYLAYLAVAFLAGRLFKSRVCVALIVVVYAFSGIGLWNSAWFYYQEAATLFFLLGCFVALLQEPTLRRGSAFLAAVLVQVASVNYWTLYNSWFVLIFAGAYALVYRNQARRLLRQIGQGIRERPKLSASMATAMFVATSMWLATIGCLVTEQAGKYIRHATTLQSGHAYTEIDAFTRVQELRRFTTELFNPRVERALANYKIINEIHCARYLGALLLPLLLAFWFLPLRRRELFLTISASLALVVCLAPPWLLKAWDAIPFMDRILHFFYFYTHHLQFLVVLLATTVLDRMLSHRLSLESRRRLSGALASSLALGLLCLIGLGLMSDRFPANDPGLEALLLASLLGTVGAFIAWQCLREAKAERRLALCLVFLVIACGDLTRYYWEVSRLDQLFTVHRYPQGDTPFPLTPPIRAALRAPWRLPQQIAQFQELMFQNMPVTNNFWPTNAYNRHRYVHEALALPAEVRTRLNLPLLSLREAQPEEVRAATFVGPQLVQSDQIVARCGYNEFDFQFVAPREGYALVGLIFDGAWQVLLDGKPVRPERANLTGMSVAVAAGSHRLQLAYRPFVRTLFWPACWVLEIVLAGLAGVSLSCGRRRVANFEPGVTETDAWRRHSAVGRPYSRRRLSTIWTRGNLAD